jgi:hypothetical protein
VKLALLGTLSGIGAPKETTPLSYTKAWFVEPVPKSKEKGKVIAEQPLMPMVHAVMLLVTGMDSP